MKLKAQEVADLVGGIVDGDKKSTITKLSKIENGENKSLSLSLIHISEPTRPY